MSEEKKPLIDINQKIQELCNNYINNGLSQEKIDTIITIFNQLQPHGMKEMYD